jgi:hypothetical protein
MAMVRMLKPALRTLDTRAARPPLKKADAELLTAEHSAWRASVLRRANYRCEAIDDGRRCTVSAPSRLFADHIRERKDGGDPLDPANGRCLCGRHHTLKTARARATRMAERF